jgi:hypothetical protein
MKWTIAVVAALAGAVLVTASAGGATNNLVGHFSTGDGSVNQNAVIGMQIKTNAKDKPKKAKNIQVDNLYYRCIESGTSGEVDFEVPGSFKIKKDDTENPPGLYFSEVVTEGTNEYYVFGDVNKKGTKVEGTVEITFGTPPEYCGNSVGGYTAKK